jgi:hypothetical protein
MSTMSAYLDRVCPHGREEVVVDQRELRLPECDRLVAEQVHCRQLQQGAMRNVEKLIASARIAWCGY